MSHRFGQPCLELAHDESVLVIQFHHAVVDDCAWANSTSNSASFTRPGSNTGRLTCRRCPCSLASMPGPSDRRESAHPSCATGKSVLSTCRSRTRCRRTGQGLLLRAIGAAKGRFLIGSDTSRLIRRVGRSHRSSPFIVLAAALTALVCAYNGTSDQIIGTPVSRRGAADLDRLMGCLTDLLPLRQVIRPGESFGDLVESTREVVWEAVAYRKIPYSAIVAGAIARKDLRMSPLCQTVLVVDDARLPLNMVGD